MASQSNATQIYTCSLSGLSPLTDPVVTPSGHICSRRLLLEKLNENGGVDPFDGSGKRSLDEGQLIELATPGTNGTSGTPIPPRPPKATSLPTLLTLLQSEFDAVLLELYDTRKALEDTRKELSSALYQNDAAVRVVARVCRERDEARGRLEEFLRGEREAAESAMNEKAAADAAAAKRGREGEAEAAEVAPSKKAKVEEGGDGAGEGPKQLGKIPSDDMDAMNATWGTLSKLRKTHFKSSKKSDASEEDPMRKRLKEWGEDKNNGAEWKKINLHKSSAKAGVLSLCSVTAGGFGGSDSPSDEYLISGGHDKQAIVYNVSKGMIAATLSGAHGDVTAVSGRIIDASGGDGKLMLVSTGSADGTVQLFSLALVEKGEAEPTLLGEVLVNGEDNADPIVDVEVHPSSSSEAVRVIAASANGTVALLKHNGGDDANLEAVASFKQESKECSYASGALHPDGLIYVGGTTAGELVLWDLKTQNVATTLECHDGNPVNGIAFSENGYHVATFSSTSSQIIIWDLRKLKKVATIDPNGGEVAIGRITSVSFDRTGAYLAYSGEDATKICVVKDWENVVCTLVPTKSSGGKKGSNKDDTLVGGVVWGSGGNEGEKVWLATGRDGERPVRIWGAE